MFFLAFVFLITTCGATAAATPQNTTITSHSHNNSTTSILQLNSTKATSKGDPIITGTVTINEYDNGTYVPLEGATITVNSTGSNSRVLGTTTTDKNGNYYLDFYSNETDFLVTASYRGCDSIINNVTATLNSTDGFDYGSSNFQLAPKVATLTGAGPWDVPSNGDFIYMQKDGSNDNYAGAINVEIDGITYTAFCIDLYTDITLGDSLYVNGPLPGTMGELSDQIDWGKVNYILNNYSPSSDDEAAAMQCAIWYFTTVQYGVYPGNDTNYPGRYQFMTYSEDGVTQDGATNVQTLAWQMIDAAQSIQYPTNITLQPKNTRLPNGGSSTLTATVTGSNGHPLSGVTVDFFTDKGSLSTTTGITDSNGQISTILSGVADSSSATVTAQVNGQYATLLYDNPANPLQNLVAMNVLPYTLSDSSPVNFDVTANVQLTQTSTSPVNAGDKVSYVVTAYNNGPNNATGIYINDAVPSGLTGVTVTPSIGSYYNGVWIIPNLYNGETETLTITGTATESMMGLNTTNTATRTAQDQYNSEDNSTSASIYTNQRSTDLKIWVYDMNGLTNWFYGSSPEYIIELYNSGPNDAHNVTVTVTLPNGLVLNGYNPRSTEGNVTVVGNILTWNVGYLCDNGYTAMDLLARLNQTGTVTLSANVTELETELTPSDNTASWDTIVNPAADVQVTQTVDNTTPKLGDNVTFTINATNNGPDNATNINITDQIPAGLSNITVNAPAGTTYTNGIWNIPSLLNGSNLTLTITGTVTSTDVVNTASFNPNTAAQYDWDRTNNAQTIKLNNNTTGNADLEIWVYDMNGNTNWFYGSSPEYIIELYNAGPDDAHNATVTVTLPNGLVLNGYNPRSTEGNVTIVGNTLTWNIGYLCNKGYTAMDLLARLNQTGTVTLSANVTASETDPNPSDNSASWDTTVNPAADVQVTQTVDNTTPKLGDNVTFTINATNNGPDNATNINITDQIPAGLSNITVNAPAGTTYTNGIWNIPTLQNGSNLTLTITGTVTATNVNNTASFNPNTATQYDWDRTNNQQTLYLDVQN